MANQIEAAKVLINEFHADQTIKDKVSLISFIIIITIIISFIMLLILIIFRMEKLLIIMQLDPTVKILNHF